MPWPWRRALATGLLSLLASGLVLACCHGLGSLDAVGGGHGHAGAAAASDGIELASATADRPLAHPSGGDADGGIDTGSHIAGRGQQVGSVVVDPGRSPVGSGQDTGALPGGLRSGQTVSAASTLGSRALACSVQAAAIGRAIRVDLGLVGAALVLLVLLATIGVGVASVPRSTARRPFRLRRGPRSEPTLAGLCRLTC